MSAIIPRVIVTLSALVTFCNAQTNSTVTRNTTKGMVQGEEVDGLNVFNGIPFAKPPVDDLRFAAPEEPDEWNDTLELDANFGVLCPQIWSPFSGGPQNETDEDCLYLTVTAPSDAEYGVSSYPVVVWIHGGGFVVGSAFFDLYDPSYFIDRHDEVIFVAINYRLGVLGFLYDYDFGTGVEGNFGFQDQIMAVDWVYENIAYFGGDPENIMIYGESAGANSVALHLLYNNDHIASGIMQSPALWIGQYGPEDHEGTAQSLSDLLGCDTDQDATDILDCWRSANYTDIANQSDVSSSPTWNTTEIPYHPMAGFERDDLDIPPLIVGTNNDESAVFVTFVTTFDEAVAQISSVWGGYRNVTITEAVFEFYNSTKDHPGRESYVNDVTDISNDIWICHARSIVENLADQDNAYYYNLDHVDTDIGGWFDTVLLGGLPICANVTCHGADIVYTFMSGGIEDELDLDDSTIDLAESMMDYWFNFATNQDPNTGVSVGVEWPGVDESENILIFDDPISTSSMDTDGRADICAFLDSVGYLEPFSMPDTETAASTESESLGNGGMIFGIIVAMMIMITFAVYVGLQCKEKARQDSLRDQ